MRFYDRKIVIVNIYYYICKVLGKNEGRNPNRPVFSTGAEITLTRDSKTSKDYV